MSESKGLKHILAGFKSLFKPPPPPPVPSPATAAPEQKRRGTRMRCAYQVECQAGKRSFKAVVADLSVTGLRLEVPHPLPVHSDITVRYENSEPLHLRVMWCARKKNRIEVGLAYLDPDDVVARSWVRVTLRHLGLEAPDDRRRHVRVQAQVTAHAFPDDGASAISGTVINLSADGCLFECGAAFRLQTRVRIQIGPLADLPELAVEGRLVRMHQVPNQKLWQLGIQFGSMRIKTEKLLGRYLAALLSSELATPP
ncbi:MAG TPA: PilZ domain-containing protein [Candidatus Xenobia bacterium]|jgi:c-di-GMP-binding flagellar brake protein YcgR